MGICDLGRCAVFCLVSVISFVVISVSSCNFIAFLSKFEFQYFYRHNHNHNENRSIEEYLCVSPRLGRGSRFWCTVMVLIWDAFLLLVFCLQHRLMARGPFKRFLARTMEEAYIVERPLYLMATALVLNWLMGTWQPLDTYLWHLDPSRWPILTLLIYIVHVCAWIIIIGETLLMDLFELMGLKQVYYYCLDMEHPLLYKTVSCQRLYRRMRHPGLVCIMVIMWLYPIMSLDRYLLISVFTLFLLYGHHVQREDYDYVVEMRDKKVMTFHSTVNTSPYHR